jgi:GGDEF domain-containing protein
MTIAPNTTSIAAPPAAAEAAVADGTTLLPAREAVLGRLAEQLPTVGIVPATLLIIGLLRPDDGWPVSRDTIAQVTTLLARSVRGDDWLGSSGPTEFVVVLGGPVTAAESAAARLVAAVADLGVPDVSASAGVTPLVADVAAGELLRQATLSLTAARRVGAGTVIRYREPS